MGTDLTVVYAHQEAPPEVERSIFLVGPTPRANTGGASWRPVMLECLRAAGYDGVVYVPEPEDGSWSANYVDQLDWEQRHIFGCDLILAWVPRNLETLPGFTTNVEFGQALTSGRLLYGRPEGSPKCRALDEYWRRQTGLPPLTTMDQMAAFAASLRRVPRREAERYVAAHLWTRYDLASCVSRIIGT
jgi:hypothetical protein